MASEGTGGGLKTFIFTGSLGLGLLGASLWALMFSWFTHIFFFTKYQLRELEDPGVLSGGTVLLILLYLDGHPRYPPSLTLQGH